MPYSLLGRNVLVTGGSKGLGAVICRKFAAAGCNIAINYSSDESAASALASELHKSSPGVKTTVLRGDCTSASDNAALVASTVTQLGGLDIIIANAGWTRFASWDLTADDALTADEWDRCWRANVTAHLQLVQAAGPVFRENKDGGVFITTSSVAGVSTSGSSMAYSVSKAAGLHLMKCFAATLGPKIRVNSVLPGLLLTEWGQKFGEEKIKAIKDKAVLGITTDLDDCADMYLTIARNSSMTGQEILIDAGLKAGLK